MVSFQPFVKDIQRRGYGHQEQQQLLRPSLLRPEELSMESGIDPGQDYYTQDYYNYDHGYDLPQYGSRRKLISPAGTYDEYGEVIVEDDGSYYYSPHESEGEVSRQARRLSQTLHRPPKFSLEDHVPRPEQTQSDPAGETVSFHSSNPVINLRTVMKINKLLAARKASGPPMPFHPPWKKNRIFPMMEKAQSAEPTKPTQGSDSSESGTAIDGIFFQSKEGKSTGEKLFSKQLHTHNNCQSNTSSNTDSSSDGKTSVSQESSDLEKKPYGFVSNRQQSESKVETVNPGAFLDPYLDTCAVSSILSQHPYSNQQNVAYMTNFDSDKEQEISEESETEQDDSEGESTTHTEQDSETDTDTESETEKESESDKESEDENISGSEKEAESEDLSESCCKVTGTQEFVRSVLQTMNETQSSKPRFTSSIAEISSTVGFNFTHNAYRISEENTHNGKDKNEQKKGSKKEDDSETRNKDPKPLMGQEKDLSKSSKSQSKSSSSAGSSLQGTTDNGNLPPIAEDEEEEMTSAGSLRSSLGNKFQGSASGAGSPEDEKEDSDTDDIFGRKKRIKLVVDREYETSSTGDDSAPESHRNRLSNVNSHSNINGSVYLAQNGSIIRTRRATHATNIKFSSPVRLGKQFKKLDKLAVTQEERVPLNSPGALGATAGEQNINTRPSSGSLASSSIGPESIACKYNVATASSEITQNVEEQESTVDNAEVREMLGSHSDRTQSDEEELWMGPWNNLHIPMTKL
ncbi:hypothetical protein PHYPO_G00032910 [Pangasianodon hypophthalmus]|uniref:Uncharacterized protein n=1 Tax=Pangasianodon hypophthalmus TaxID=310915 RepID=A0A5N5MK98_PANHP|nr:hypothetical protein PHYPO_G00032910 [Pangasianodon hypophthalmus]